MVTLKSPVTSLAGIGPKKAEMFKKIDVYTVGDLLRRFPRAYQNRGDIRTLAEAGMTGDFCAMMLTVGTRPSTALLKNRMTLTKFSAFDDTGKCEVVFFNQNYIKDAFALGATYRFWGKLTHQKNKWSLTAPQFEPFTGARSLPDYVPVYPLGGGIGQKMMRSTVGIALASLDEAPDVIPKSIREKYQLLSLQDAFYTVHSPMNPERLAEARRYFVFEELFLFALSVARSKKERTGETGIVLKISEGEMNDFLSALTFTLTEAQSRVLADIRRDLASGFAMHRLVSGDVGSGKTVIAAAAAYIAVKSGYQAAMMAPTEILARQHYNDLAPLFTSLGIRVGLLVGNMTPAKKRKLHEDAAKGEIDFVIGTHALLTESMRFARPALMITDEQHRFGVKQRATLAEKGENLHILVMSATPIPRTLALVLYGDLDISTIDQLPPKRQKVSTFLVDESYRARLNGFIKKQADEGRQVYIVCPAIEDTADDEDEGGVLVTMNGEVIDKKPLRRAVEYAKELSISMPTVTVGCLHGKMPAQEKDRVMAAFERGEISVLVSTTVIEVGVNIPNATLMVIENADRFGLSQLHQLRGRVGRGVHKSWCILVSDSENDDSLRRMRALCETNDGYRIAEFDLAQRGPGDFFASEESNRQSGEFKFRVASLCDDTELLSSAFAEATRVIAEDADLLAEENTALKEACDAFALAGKNTIS